MRWLRLLNIILLVFIIAVVFYIGSARETTVSYDYWIRNAQELDNDKFLPTPKSPPERGISEEGNEIILLDVPFTSQAPFGEWHDPRQQDGCEEATSLMVVYWAQGKTLDKQIAKQEILAASEYQKEKYGEYRDTSATTTAQRIIKEYFNYDNFEVKQASSSQDIIVELLTGHVVITPMNGQALGNPYYTAPGPERHMLLIRGYDFTTQEFITNDNGTRNGEEYRYKQDVLFKAIRDYPSGYHVPIEGMRKVMIVVEQSRADN